MRPFDLAIITGSKGDFGSYVAITFANRGWETLALSREMWDMEKGVEPVFHLLQAHERIKNWRRVLLVHNAAYHPIKFAREMPAEEAEKAIRVNLLAPIQVTQEFLRLFPQGEVAMISSASTEKTVACWSLYIAGKSGMIGYLRTLEKEGVPVHVFDPGMMNTELQKKIREANFPDARRFEFLHRMGHLQEPDHVAAQFVEGVVSRGLPGSSNVSSVSISA